MAPPSWSFERACLDRALRTGDALARDMVVSPRRSVLVNEGDMLIAAAQARIDFNVETKSGKYILAAKGLMSGRGINWISRAQYRDFYVYHRGNFLPSLMAFIICFHALPISDRCGVLALFPPLARRASLRWLSPTRWGGNEH
jgi:hypothetical protein